MNQEQWKAFKEFRDEFKSHCIKWAGYSDELIPLQKSSSKKDTPDYPIETPVVYNTALDDLTPDSEIKLIVIGDNPGKNEQLSINQKYLVGQAGKIAEGFFLKNPELNIDFRTNAIILNKTPIHSAKTKHLSQIESGLIAANSPAATLIQESQSWMAERTAELHQKLVAAADSDSYIPELWLVGYSELKNGGLFLNYRDTLASSYNAPVAGITNSDSKTTNPGAVGITNSDSKTSNPGTVGITNNDSRTTSSGTAGITTNSGLINTTSQPPAWQNVFVYQHFSMNRFAIDLKNHRAENPAQTLKESLENLGTIHRQEIFS